MVELGLRLSFGLLYRGAAIYILVMATCEDLIWLVLCHFNKHPFFLKVCPLFDLFAIHLFVMRWNAQNFCHRFLLLFDVYDDF